MSFYEETYKIRLKLYKACCEGKTKKQRKLKKKLINLALEKQRERGLI